MKTNIFLFTFNRPDLLKNQVHSIRKNFVGDYSITVVHDSRGDDFVAEFTEEADRLNVEYVHYESFPGRSPSQYHADTINKAYENLIKDDCSGEIALLLDHDMFLIDELNLSETMESLDLLGCLQNRDHVRYIWPGLFAFKVDSVSKHGINCDPGVFRDGLALDTGGGTHVLLEDPQLTFEDTGVEYPDTFGETVLNDQSVTQGYDSELHYGGKFFHFRNSCNWHNGFNVVSHAKTELMTKVLEEILVD